MSLAQSLKQQPLVKKGPACWAEQFKRALPPEEWQALLTALGDPSWSTAAITDALRGEGYRVGSHSVGRHRQRKCACGDEVWS
jgi:hypothetical protein